MSLSLGMSPTLPKQTLMPDSGYRAESNRYNRPYKWVRTTAKRELESRGTQPWLKPPGSDARQHRQTPDSFTKVPEGRILCEIFSVLHVGIKFAFFKDTA